ncbi:hypothetical protein CANCADRAFT_2460 [Tortispora caseinolytica NRRL Y-17796]|uniref:Transcription activator GCR1-like domain-containing protein n=1 Tax=Tortispora caseinolytica NRRL Y-17796 TaxID=767744 RepID=A0A1E4TG30_9ASCO|nr:hypothetical protein CANCADRAFT_2460 [Tortispora caseinolytica NRRL Y-17796]
MSRTSSACSNADQYILPSSAELTQPVSSIPTEINLEDNGPAGAVTLTRKDEELIEYMKGRAFVKPGSIRDIWWEYAHGIAGKPPLREMERWSTFFSYSHIPPPQANIFCDRMWHIIRAE